MKYLLILVAASAFAAPEAQPSMPASAISVMQNNKSVIFMESRARAFDYVQAFEVLKKDKPTFKIMIRTTSGSMLNVTDLTAAHSGTLLFVRALSSQGSKMQILPVDEIAEIGYSP